jgi:hypothetical protein
MLSRSSGKKFIVERLASRESCTHDGDPGYLLLFDGAPRRRILQKRKEILPQ